MLLYLCKKYQTKKYSINNDPVINGLGVIDCTTSGTTISIHRIFDLITVESTNIRSITFRVYLRSQNYDNTIVSVCPVGRGLA